ncbi:MAG: IclR family transcriptional regulator [Burkholderiaceae bacterium]
MSDVKAALRTLRVFELFAARGQPLVLSELAEQLEIPASSCLLLVRTLLQHGYLYEVARRGGYYPTRKLLDCARLIVDRDPVVERVRPVLVQLQAETGESVTLSKLQGLQLIYLMVLDSAHLLRPALAVGMARPLHAAASGKALLSLLDAEARQKLLREAGMARLTANTLSSRSALESQLQEGAERGWFESLGESEPELAAMAVPLSLGSEPYAITVLGTLQRIRERRARNARSLQAARAAIEGGW